MRVLRRRAAIITLFALAVLPMTTAQTAAQAAVPEPWATVNVCNTPGAPNTIGIRASMPGSPNGTRERFMRFVVQYFSRGDQRWQAVAEGGDSGYLAAGKGRRRTEVGRSFRIEPTQGGDVLLRGRVIFKWRRGGEVVRSATTVTRKGHRSSAGASPAGFSAATCTITSGA